MVQLWRYSKHRLQIKDFGACKRDKSAPPHISLLPVNIITGKSIKNSVQYRRMWDHIEALSYSHRWLRKSYNNAVNKDG